MSFEKQMSSKGTTCFSSFLLAMKVEMITEASFFPNRTKPSKEAVKDQTMNLAVTLLLFQAFVDRWRYNAKRASLAQSRLKALEKL